MAVDWREGKDSVARIFPSLLYLTEFGTLYELRDMINKEMTSFRENIVEFTGFESKHSTWKSIP